MKKHLFYLTVFLSATTLGFSTEKAPSPTQLVLYKAHDIFVSVESSQENVEPTTLEEHPDLSRYTNPATQGPSKTKKIVKGIGMGILVFFAAIGALYIGFGIWAISTGFCVC